MKRLVFVLTHYYSNAWTEVLDLLTWLSLSDGGQGCLSYVSHIFGVM